MSWVKLDDQFWSNKKVRKAKESAVVYVRVLSWCAFEESDGSATEDDVALACMGLADLDRHLAVLVEVGLFERTDDGYLIPDFLEYNFSREQAEARREKDRLRKAAREAQAEAKRKAAVVPDGIQTESRRNPHGFGPDSKCPEPEPEPEPEPQEITTQRASEIEAESTSLVPVSVEAVPAPTPARKHETVDVAIAETIAERYAQHAGTERQKVTTASIDSIRLLRERGPATWAKPRAIDPADIFAMVHHVFDHMSTPERSGFCWANNVRSGDSLRRAWDQLVTARNVTPNRTVNGVDPGVALLAALKERESA